MNMISKQKPNKRRNIVSFEPCGPVLAMIENATKGRGLGAKTNLLQNAVAELCRKTQPKLYERFMILKNEDAA